MASLKAVSNAGDDAKPPPDVQTFQVDDKSQIFVVLNAGLKGAAHLANLLPTGTYSVFLILAPLLSDTGDCVHRPLRKLMLTVLLVGCFTLCLASCFTDSFKTLDGSIHYGIITTRGLWTPQLSKQVAMCPRYRLKGKDVAHGALVLLVLAGATLLNRDVIGCLFDRRVSGLAALGVAPLLGFVASVVFVFWPSERHGVGYPVVEAEAVQAAAEIAAALRDHRAFGPKDGDEAEKAERVNHGGGKSVARVHPVAVGLALSKSRKGNREN